MHISFVLLLNLADEISVSVTNPEYKWFTFRKNFLNQFLKKSKGFSFYFNHFIYFI